MPPGRNTRNTSAMTIETSVLAFESANSCNSPKQYTPWKEQSTNDKCLASQTTNGQEAKLVILFLLASDKPLGEASTPMTSNPRRTSTMLSRPTPHPRSRMFRAPAEVKRSAAYRTQCDGGADMTRSSFVKNDSQRVTAFMADELFSFGGNIKYLLQSCTVMILYNYHTPH